jgi:hypothetical protein
MPADDDNIFRSYFRCMWCISDAQLEVTIYGLHSEIPADAASMMMNTKVRL